MRTLATALAVATPLSAFAATVSIDTSSVVAGLPNQPITFSASGGETVQGVTFYVLLSNGNATAPTFVDFSSIDLDSGSIWAGKNPSQNDAQILSTAYAGSLDSDSTTLNGGTFATIYVNATSLSPGNTFTVSLLDVLDPGNDTFFSSPEATTINIDGETSATITAVVPEPAAIGLFASTLLFGLRRRRA